jgi:hypothetical protein
MGVSMTKEVARIGTLHLGTRSRSDEVRLLLKHP